MPSIISITIIASILQGEDDYELPLLDPIQLNALALASSFSCPDLTQFEYRILETPFQPPDIRKKIMYTLEGGFTGNEISRVFIWQARIDRDKYRPEVVVLLDEKDEEVMVRLDERFGRRFKFELPQDVDYDDDDT